MESTESSERLSWVGSRKKPDSPPSTRSDLLSLYLHLCFESNGVLTEANPQQSFSSSVAETEKIEEEEDGGEDIGATVICSCEMLANHLTSCGDRVIKAFMIQGGDNSANDWTGGGESIYG
ncbi:hypothetical protein Bca4012_017605 [Brassica carinata]